MMLTNEELAAIEARANVAIREGWVEQLDASARDIPALLAEVRRLGEENERYRQSGYCKSACLKRDANKPLLPGAVMMWE